MMEKVIGLGSELDRQGPMPLALRFLEEAECPQLFVQPEFGDDQTYLGLTTPHQDDYTTD